MVGVRVSAWEQSSENMGSLGPAFTVQVQAQEGVMVGSGFTVVLA